MTNDPVPGGAEAVIVTVAGLLLVTPLLTINCATYVPATSAMKDDDTPLAAESAALLPDGRVISDQE